MSVPCQPYRVVRAAASWMAASDSAGVRVRDTAMLTLRRTGGRKVATVVGAVGVPLKATELSTRRIGLCGSQQ